MMSNLEKILQEFKTAATTPREILDRYLSQGKKVVGCFPIYTPEELVHAGSMIPMGLWGGQISPAIAGKYSPIFICSIMRSCLEYGMSGVYDGVCCTIMPMLCDTYRGMNSAWKAGSNIPLISMIHPQNRDSAAAHDFMVAEYQAVREQLEEITGCKITDEALEKSIEIYNDHSRAILEFSEEANNHLDVITPVVRHAVMKSATFLEKSEHTKMLRALLDELKARPKHTWMGKKVILTGITAEPDEFLEIFSENNIAVVGDDLAQESRLYRTLIPNGKTPMDRLAAQWLNRYGCCVVHETDLTRGKMLVEMAKKTGADAVAVCLMRFCDMEEYDYPYISNEIELTGIYCLCLEVDQSTQNNEQSRTKIQSFAEKYRH